MAHMAAVFLVGFQGQLARVYEEEGLVGGSGDSQQACSWMLRDHDVFGRRYPVALIRIRFLQKESSVSAASMAISCTRMP